MRLLSSDARAAENLYALFCIFAAYSLIFLNDSNAFDAPFRIFFTILRVPKSIGFGTGCLRCFRCFNWAYDE
jgi:hypothetical protein